MSILRQLLWVEISSVSQVGKVINKRNELQREYTCCYTLVFLQIRLIENKFLFCHVFTQCCGNNPANVRFWNVFHDHQEVQQEVKIFENRDDFERVCRRLTNEDKWLTENHRTLDFENRFLWNSSLKKLVPWNIRWQNETNISNLRLWSAVAHIAWRPLNSVMGSEHVSLSWSTNSRSRRVLMLTPCWLQICTSPSALYLTMPEPYARARRHTLWRRVDHVALASARLPAVALTGTRYSDHQLFCVLSAA